VLAEELEGNLIELEGRELVVVERGHADTDHATCLHVVRIMIIGFVMAKSC
jgi:hypothetical protein